MHGFNWFALLSDKVSGENIHIITGVFVLLLLVIAAVVVRKKLLRLEQTLVPEQGVSLTNIFELLVESFMSLMEGIVGKTARDHVPLVVSVFVFIFVSNLIGLIPAFLPPTANINTNLAIAACVFLYFNYMGIKEHGFVSYIKHFAGPVWWLSPLIMAIELFGTAIRPITLSLRLFCNINADHLVLSIFSSLSPVIVPVVFMILGIFIAFVQAFVFTLLSVIYIALATAHEEEHEHAHH